MGVFVFTLLHGSISIFHAVLPAFFKDFRITELVLLVYIVASIAVSVAVVSI